MLSFPLAHINDVAGLGNTWAPFMGECTKETAFQLLDTFYDLGGNFIDTANSYQGGESEQWIGEWIKKTGRRSEMVVATKYTMSSKTGHPVQQSNYGGTGAKSLHVSIHNSLKALDTDYVDIVGIPSQSALKRTVLDTCNII
jgi:aryl-alcohol dehydrogenase-like predicted oxidoreductase